MDDESGPETDGIISASVFIPKIPEEYILSQINALHEGYQPAHYAPDGSVVVDSLPDHIYKPGSRELDAALRRYDAVVMRRIRKPKKRGPKGGQRASTLELLQDPEGIVRKMVEDEGLGLDDMTWTNLAKHRGIALGTLNTYRQNHPELEDPKETFRRLYGDAR